MKGYLVIAPDGRKEGWTEGQTSIDKLISLRLRCGDKNIINIYPSSVPVGAVPDMLFPTHDCEKVLVAVEAEPYDDAGTPVDPEGAVALIKFQDSPAESYNLKILDFRNFNDQ